MKPSYDPLSSEENEDIVNNEDNKAIVTQFELHEPPKTCINITLGWIALFCAILSGSAIGPMFKYMEEHNINPAQAAAWYTELQNANNKLSTHTLI
jgi:hypothetical protein